MYAACDASLFIFVASRIPSINLQNHKLRECGEIIIGEHFGLAQDSLRIILTDVNLTKLTT